ncbi:MAG: carboxypeptidase regulatory-like domain-containing protein [Acidobacteria bacterium]|nr:carboxypeptidase regulatory-like domain-containing protein [Acidobacteriota bacterium]
MFKLTVVTQKLEFSIFTLLIIALLAVTSQAQTATTGTLIGSVTDKNGAVLSGAEVELTNTSTNLTIKTTTNDEGQYVFPAIAPGVYKIAVTKSGFRKANITDFKVDVAKSYTVPISLEIGDVQQTVEVTAAAGVELQTTDSTVGNVIAGKEMPLLPALTRQANDLLRIQPLSTPGGEVAGSRNDQTTITLDGIDITNQSTGGLGTVIPIPIDSIEEFRVGVANPNASFGRGAGGQASVISRRGTSDYHGLLFWYHQNDNLNAATWTAKRTIAQTVTDPKLRAKQQEPELKDNRFGFRFGGPVIPWSETWKKKLFFFANYEGRRFPRTTQILRIVPSDSLRQGILRFRDASGAVASYDLKTSTLCGPNGDQPCDPRGIGISPVVSNLFRNLPAGNDPSAGDGFNTTGFRGIVTNPLNNDFYNTRFDYNVTDKWRADFAFRYFGELATNSGLLDIRGGNVRSRETAPTRQNMISAGLSGLITQNLSGEFRFGWVRTRTAVDRLRPNGSAAELALPGTETGFSAGQSHVALDLGALGGAQSILSEPIDVDTQLARKQSNDNKNIQWNADLNWVRGNQTWQFGTHVRWLPTLHRRDDKVLGALGALVAQIDSELGAFSLPNSVRPPACSATVTRNCLGTADVQTWNRTLASVLGIVDNVSVLAVRDGELKPLPFGETLESDTKLWAPELYWQDIWRIKPSLTLTFGLNYGWQTAPTERLGRQSIQVDGQSLTPQTAREYLATREAVARQGGIYNPPIAFLPVNNAKRSVFDVDWNNLAPRVAVSWNPGGSGGFFGKLLGERKTVIRGGYSLIFDRQNTVQSVIIPTLGVAFAQTINVSAPRCNVNGAGGAGCAATNANPALNGYRVGVDGRIPLPTVPTLSIPVSPYWGPNPTNPSGTPVLFPEVLSFQVDPRIEVPENHAINLTVQRELPGNMLLELGYSGRIAKKLTQSMSFGQVPYNHVDRASGQTFAQAFDAVARQLRTGTAATAVTPQPWFENQVPGGNGTRVLAAAQASNFINGNINNVFLNLDTRRLQAGLQSFNNYIARTLFLRASTGESNYNAAFVTLNKRFSKGFLATVNYTFARSLDQLGANQNSANVMPNSFDLNAEYGPSPFDITHIVNSTFRYDLPFGKGRFFNTGNFLDKIVGGWYVSGIYTARSGDALTVNQGAGVWGGSLFLGFTSGAIPTVDPNSFGNDINRGVNGSNNIGTNGDPANRGTGLNLFGNPESVFNSFRRVEISSDGRAGRANPLRGPSRWNVDLSLGKQTTIKEGLKVTFLADFFNAFNNVIFANPTLDLNNSRAFGVLTTQFIAPERGGTAGSRWIQMGLRIEF